MTVGYRARARVDVTLVGALGSNSGGCKGWPYQPRSGIGEYCELDDLVLTLVSRPKRTTVGCVPIA